MSVYINPEDFCEKCKIWYDEDFFNKKCPSCKIRKYEIQRLKRKENRKINKIEKIAWWSTVVSMVLGAIFSAIGVFMYEEWYMYLICFIVFGASTIVTAFIGRLMKR